MLLLRLSNRKSRKSESLEQPRVKSFVDFTHSTHESLGIDAKSARRSAMAPCWRLRTWSESELHPWRSGRNENYAWPSARRRHTKAICSLELNSSHERRAWESKRCKSSSASSRVAILTRDFRPNPTTRQFRRSADGHRESKCKLAAPQEEDPGANPRPQINSLE